MTDPRSDRVDALADTFVGLADTLVDDYDVVELFDRLVLTCVSLLGVTAAGLLLDDQQGHLAVVAASTEATGDLEAFQLQSDEGPCLDCVRTRAPVTCDDLSTTGQERWPVFGPAAVTAGYRSVNALPLRLRDHAIGALNLFHAQPGPIPDADRRLAQAFADVATIGILQRRALYRSGAVVEQLQHALTSRVAIEQAKGVIAERHGLGMSAAFAVLRREARDSNRKITEVAHAIVRGEPTAVAR